MRFDLRVGQLATETCQKGGEKQKTKWGRNCTCGCTGWRRKAVRGGEGEREREVSRPQTTTSPLTRAAYRSILASSASIRLLACLNVLFTIPSHLSISLASTVTAMLCNHHHTHTTQPVYAFSGLSVGSVCSMQVLLPTATRCDHQRLLSCA